MAWYLVMHRDVFIFTLPAGYYEADTQTQTNLKVNYF
jgi:hypothetical protein